MTDGWIRTCSRCEQRKPISEFYKNQGGYQCKKCLKEYNRAHKYGLTTTTLEELRIKQRNMCAICGYALGPKFNVDHDHETGQIRGLLCYGCNTALGKFHDSERILLNAIRYLREHRQVAPSTLEVATNGNNNQ